MRSVIRDRYPRWHYADVNQLQTRKAKARASIASSRSERLSYRGSCVVDCVLRVLLPGNKEKFEFIGGSASLANNRGGEIGELVPKELTLSQTNGFSRPRFRTDFFSPPDKPIKTPQVSEFIRKLHFTRGKRMESRPHTITLPSGRTPARCWIALC